MSATPDRPLLEVDGLTVRFGEATVVDGVSFTVGAGERFGLVGESGSGKSITALSILRLVDMARTEGRIVFDGRELLGRPEREMRALRGTEIAMIFQEPMSALNPLYTVGNQVAEVLVQHALLSPRQARERAVELLASTGIAEPARRAGDYPHQLSGGQRQRAMIAMALACRPRLLIADEPTTALDVTVQAQILELLDRLQREIGMALLFITHDLALVRRHTQRVGVMERGRLVECAATAEVFAAPRHPYTRRLLASRPQRIVQPAEQAGAALLSAKGVAVHFPVRLPWFRRRDFVAVRGATLALRRGQTLGIVGESGSGKTTLGLALLALQPLAGGRVALGGERVDTAPRQALRRLRRRMQVVFQDPYSSLNPRLTVGQIVGEGLALHRPELDAAARERAVLAMLDEVGLGERHGVAAVLQRYPHEFSGGQRQRIAIARAVVLRPALLVLDEPTSALDVTVQQQVLALLAELQRVHGMSYIVISHDLAVIRAMAHHVLVMKDGAIVEQGEVESLFAAPREAYTRALLAAAVGAALGLAGALAQGLFRNPLADPGLLGVTSGAVCAVALVLTFFAATAAGLPPAWRPWVLPLAAFGGALAVCFMLDGVARWLMPGSIAGLLLTGLALNALTMAVVGLCTFVADDEQLRSLTFWTLGSLAGASWLVASVLLLALALALWQGARLAQALNALALGESAAAHVGVDVQRLRTRLIVTVALLCGLAVAWCGLIGFIGLMAPHLVRSVVGGDQRAVLPLAALAGALLLLLADTLARTVVIPAEMPVGIITALIGAPIFLLLLRRLALRQGGHA